MRQAGQVIFTHSWPRAYERFFMLSIKFSLLINMKMPTIVSFKVSCSAMFSKKEFAVISTLRFISRTKFMLR